MQNKNYKIDLERKRLQTGSRVITPIIKSRVLYTHKSSYTVNSKTSSSHNQVMPFVEGNGIMQNKGTIIDEKLQGWHTMMLQAFEGFLFQLDELFTNFRTEKHVKNVYCLPIFNNYKDICEKLRLEVLIAIDKLEITNAKRNKKDSDVEFINKMTNLKSQLSQIRRQYHQAIQEFNVSNK